MKKFLSAVLAFGMAASLASAAFAANGSHSNAFDEKGDIYIRRDGNYESTSGSLIPGETAWVVLGRYKYSGDYYLKEVKNIKVLDNDALDGEAMGSGGRDVSKIISVSRSAKKVEIEDGEYYWCAEIDVKRISPSSYPEDGYQLQADLELEFDWENRESSNNEGTERTDVNLDSVEYEMGDDLEEYDQLFEFDVDDDIDLQFPDGGEGSFTGVARRDVRFITHMSYDINSNLLNKYPNARLDFYTSTGDFSSTIRDAHLNIEAPSGSYCYEINSAGNLIDHTSTYDKSARRFEIRTAKLGKYVVSDRALQAVIDTPLTPEVPTTPTTPSYPSNPSLPMNPETGCLA